MQILGVRIKNLRKKKGLTQQELGKLIGVTKVSISCYEKGSRIPTLDTIIRLADSLSVPLNYLLGGEVFAVSEEDQNYSINVSKRDIDILREIKNHNKLYLKLLDNPKRVLDYLEDKIR